MRAIILSMVLAAPAMAQWTVPTTVTAGKDATFKLDWAGIPARNLTVRVTVLWTGPGGTSFSKGSMNRPILGGSSLTFDVPIDATGYVLDDGINPAIAGTVQ